MINECCLNCEYARKIADDNLKRGLVGCRFLSEEWHENNTLAEFDIKGNMYEGWIWNGRRPYLPKSNSATISEGLMTNFCVITEQNGKCNGYEFVGSDIAEQIYKAKETYKGDK